MDDGHQTFDKSQIKYGIVRYLLVLMFESKQQLKTQVFGVGAGHLPLAIKLSSVSSRSSCARPIFSFHKPLVTE